MLRRLALSALVLASLAGIILPVENAHARRGGPRHAAMILDANTGAVLHNDDGDDLRHPASLTKMMTLYLTFETIEAGRLKMSDRVPVSDEAASQAPSNLDLKAGDDISVQDAIKALITKSANDVAVALAEKIGGTERNFVRLMNARAKDIGMTKTNFENASGLPNSDQVTTARDMITLGLRLQDDYPKYYPLFALTSFTYERNTYRNHNTLMNHFTGIDGIKTGYTSASGFNLVSSYRRGGRHIVGAVFGGSSAGSRNGEMRNLLTRTFNRASSNKTRKAPPSPLIAMMKLKSEPKLAERPQKPKPKPVIVAEAAPLPAKPVAAKPAPKIAEPKPVVAETPAPAVEETVAVPAPATEETPAEPVVAVQQLEVAKVKQIAMATPQGPQRPKPTADETTDMPEEQAANEAADLMATPAEATPETTEVAIPDAPPADTVAEALQATETPSSSQPETIVPKLAAAKADLLPSTLEPGQRAMLGAPDSSVPTAQAQAAQFDVAPVAVAPLAETAAAPQQIIKEKIKAPSKPKPVAKILANIGQQQRGLPPSTFQAQAATLQPTHAGSQNFAALPAAAGRYEIQIGAYASIDEAQKALANVQTRAGALLQTASTVTHPAQSGGRQVFRARFSGFDSAGATRACNELRRQAVDCFVMTAN